MLSRTPYGRPQPIPRRGLRTADTEVPLQHLTRYSFLLLRVDALPLHLTAGHSLFLINGRKLRTAEPSETQP